MALWFMGILPKNWQPIAKLIDKLLAKGGTVEKRHAAAVEYLVKKGYPAADADADITTVDRIIRFLRGRG